MGTPKSDLSPETFTALAKVAYDVAGLHLPETKRSMMAARIARRMSRLAVTSFEDYLDLISQPVSKERSRMVAALTTNVSQFFRESHHFQYLRDHVLPALLERAENGDRIRIWSAGCANGQEAYSISMSLLDVLPKVAHLDIRVLGTDIDPAVVRLAQFGTYHASMMTGLTDGQKARHFKADPSSNSYRVSPELQKLTIFRELNLHGPWPMPGRFDIIFCRNVVIYFDQQKQQELWSRFHEKLHRNGWLMVGHSERITSPQNQRFELAGPTLYQRLGKADQ